VAVTISPVPSNPVTPVLSKVKEKNNSTNTNYKIATLQTGCPRNHVFLKTGKW